MCTFTLGCDLLAAQWVTVDREDQGEGDEES